jgi:outer membrane receptor protein involved in Fe transport
VGYSWGGARVGLNWRYIDGMLAPDVGDPSVDYPIPSYDYLDLYAGYEFNGGMLTGLSLSGGVENLTDEDPPLLPTVGNANTDTGLYDVLGRSFYARLSYRF